MKLLWQLLQDFLDDARSTNPVKETSIANYLRFVENATRYTASPKAPHNEIGA